VHQAVQLNQALIQQVLKHLLKAVMLVLVQVLALEQVLVLD
jgi:hypothetical protein